MADPLLPDELLRLEVTITIVPTATTRIITAKIHQCLNRKGVLAAGSFTVKVPDCPFTSML